MNARPSLHLLKHRSGFIIVGAGSPWVQAIKVACDWDAKFSRQITWLQDWSRSVKIISPPSMWTRKHVLEKPGSKSTGRVTLATQFDRPKTEGSFLVFRDFRNTNSKSIGRVTLASVTVWSPEKNRRIVAHCVDTNIEVCNNLRSLAHIIQCNLRFVELFFLLVPDSKPCPAKVEREKEEEIGPVKFILIITLIKMASASTTPILS